MPLGGAALSSARIRAKAKGRTAMSISKSTSFAALLILSTASICHAANANALIGSWKFAGTTKSGGASACDAIFVFADKMMAITAPVTATAPQGSTRRMIVAYVAASPTFVGVQTSGNLVEYNIPDNNHMDIEDPWGKCSYVRTK
jgi:hypothetical protein